MAGHDDVLAQLSAWQGEGHQVAVATVVEPLDALLACIPGHFRTWMAKAELLASLDELEDALRELERELRAERMRRIEFTGLRLAAGLGQLLAVLLAMLGPNAWPAILALALHNAGILGRGVEAGQ